jgi:hypothetical protein
MKTKSIILFGLVAVTMTAALVFDGVSHRRTTIASQTLAQVTVANAGASPDSTNAATDVQPNNDQAAASTDAATTQNAGQDASSEASSDAASEEQPTNDADADASQASAPQPIIVPAGTTVTVRLGEDLGSRISKAGQRFSATLDRDIVVRGETVIAAGATVSGRVLAANPAGPVAGEANLQLKLTSVKLDNGSVSLATSARSFGPKIKGKNKVGRFMKGLVKRAAGEEKEVLLAEQSTYSFSLQKRLEIQ